MKRRLSKKRDTSAMSAHRIGKLRDVFEGIAPGETKEVDENTWAINPIFVALDPPEPIKKNGKRKLKKK